MTKHWKNSLLPLLCWLSAAIGNPPGLAAQKTGDSFFSLIEGERLTYKLLWPSGINLGEAILQFSSSGKELHFQFTVDASLPQYILGDSFSSVASREGLCSLQFRQKIKEGTRTWEESIEFDQAARRARRSRGGQTTTASVPDCARDPLAFLYYFRSLLAAGQSLGSGTVHLGANFNLRFAAAGPETVMVGGRQRPAEKFVVTYTGPNWEKTFELWISADSARAPLRIRVPFPLAVFSAELQ